MCNGNNEVWCDECRIAKAKRNYNEHKMHELNESMNGIIGLTKEQIFWHIRCVI